MQIVEGHIITTIGKYAVWFHRDQTGGVPGRHDLDGKRKVNLRAVMQAILDTATRAALHTNSCRPGTRSPIFVKPSRSAISARNTSTVMRLPPIPPEKLNPEQLALHDRMKTGVQAHPGAFNWRRADGAPIGPFNPMLHLLMAGARFGSRCEPCAHEFVAARAGLSKQKIANMIAGDRPGGLPPKRLPPSMLPRCSAGAVCFLKRLTRQAND
jgi:hypothetical protein